MQITEQVESLDSRCDGTGYPTPNTRDYVGTMRVGLRSGILEGLNSEPKTRNPKEYSRNIHQGPYIPFICLLYSRGSLFGVPT